MVGACYFFEGFVMIHATYARTMARYDRWQNRAYIAAADRLTDTERWQDRGAFFRSIAETLNHILWDHHIWIARQRSDHMTVTKIGSRHPYTDTPRNWSDYKRDRTELDDEIGAWCENLTDTDMSRGVRWMRGET